jgi:dolichol-phosphate mannosyltransferase
LGFHTLAQQPRRHVAGAPFRQHSFVSMCSNFILNRRFSFSFARRGPWFPQFASFLGASVLGAVVNYALTLATLRHLPSWRPQAASLIGIAAGTAFNFAASRYLIFRTSLIRSDAPQT